MQQTLRTRGTDYSLLLVVGGLLLIGLVMVYSASHRLAYNVYENAGYYLALQGIWLALGVVAMYSMMLLDYRVWRRLSIPVMALVLLLRVLVLAFGELQGGSRRWLFHFSFPLVACRAYACMSSAPK